MEKQKKAAFYCHMFHTSCSCSYYLARAAELLKSYPGMDAWGMEIFRETRAGRNELNRLQDEIREGTVGVIITLEASTISRDWDVFGRFMELCEKYSVPVFCLEWWKHDDDANRQYRMLKLLERNYYKDHEALK